MERDASPCHFWLGIDAEHDEAEWQALVRQRLDESRICPPLRTSDPRARAERVPEAVAG